MQRSQHNEMANRRGESRMEPLEWAAEDFDAPMKKRVSTVSDDLIEPDFPHEAHHGEEAASHVGGADDALGLYLKQMGAIPLLNREKELSLATKLEGARRRYRRAVLFAWWAQARIAGIFKRIHAGLMPIDPQIDVVHSLNLDRDRILARLPHNLRTLQQLIKKAPKDFALQQRAKSAQGRSRMQRHRWRQLRKAIRLVEELSPRTELLDAMTEEL